MTGCHPQTASRQQHSRDPRLRATINRRKCQLHAILNTPLAATHAEYWWLVLAVGRVRTVITTSDCYLAPPRTRRPMALVVGDANGAAIFIHHPTLVTRRHRGKHRRPRHQPLKQLIYGRLRKPTQECLDLLQQVRHVTLLPFGLGVALSSTAT
jgi:hypothetical protein